MAANSLTYARYPKNWPALRRKVWQRAGRRCEGSPAYPDCRVANGERHPVTGSTVVLTVVQFNLQSCDPGNLRLYCQCCHAGHRRKDRRRYRAIRDLFDGV
jgi:hypothetical protein